MPQGTLKQEFFENGESRRSNKVAWFAQPHLSHVSVSLLDMTGDVYSSDPVIRTMVSFWLFTQIPISAGMGLSGVDETSPLSEQDRILFGHAESSPINKEWHDKYSEQANSHICDIEP